MSGIKALRKIQLGRESTAGTAVAATTVWRGIGVLHDAREIVFPNEDVGILGKLTRAYSPKYAAAIELSEVEATFEQIAHLLEMGIMTATPDRDDVGGYADTGSGYIRTYNFPTTAANTLKTYTIQGGDNQRADIAEYCFAEKITLSGKGGEAVMMSADLVARQATDGEFTGSLAIPTVEEIIFSKGELSIDGVADDFGDTAKTNTLLEFKLEIDTGWRARFSAVGDKYFSHLNQVAPSVELMLKMEHNSNAETEITAARAQTVRLVQLLFQGAALTTPGDYSYKTLTINIPGIYKEIPPLDDDDGSDIVEMTLVGGYDSTKATAGQIILVNETASL